MAPTFLMLPGEILNIIYNFVLDEPHEITVRDGLLFPHPLAQSCRQTRCEFTSLAKGRNLSASRIVLQLENFDLENSVRTLERCIDASSTSFDIYVRVTKQLDRDSWAKIWPWVDYCDRLASSRVKQELGTSYTVSAKLGGCNMETACHMLYVEAIPYILKSGGIRASSVGYQQVEKIRLSMQGFLAKQI